MLSRSMIGRGYVPGRLLLSKPMRGLRCGMSLFCCVKDHIQTMVDEVVCWRCSRTRFMALKLYRERASNH